VSGQLFFKKFLALSSQTTNKEILIGSDNAGLHLDVVSTAVA